MRDMTVLRSAALFLLAALAEIGGAWLVWQGVREHRGLLFAGAGVLALGAYGFVATLQPDPHFGRILAAYGGVFVAGSLVWGVLVAAQGVQRLLPDEQHGDHGQRGDRGADQEQFGRGLPVHVGDDLPDLRRQ